jgi:hypothetical protein
VYQSKARQLARVSIGIERTNYPQMSWGCAVTSGDKLDISKFPVHATLRCLTVPPCFLEAFAQSLIEAMITTVSQCALLPGATMKILPQRFFHILIYLV